MPWFQGYTRFQLKLGGNAADDIDRIKECRKVLDKKDLLIGDANTGTKFFYSVAVTLAFLLNNVNLVCFS